MQELCTRMLARIDELRRVERPGPWLARALHNLYVDQARHAARSPVDAVAELPDVPDPEPGPERAASGSSRR